jgi:hypothetical protein
VQVVPFGTDAADETFDMRIWGWSKCSIAEIWVPTLLLDISCTLGAIDGAVIGADHLMCDTITVNDGAADNGRWLSVISPAEDLVASIMVNTRGCRYLDFDFDLTGAAAANAFFRGVE